MNDNTEPRENIALGILWMLATMCLFTSMDAVAKYLTQTIPLPQVLWARFTFHMLWLFVLLRSTAISLFHSRAPILQLLRSAFLLLTTVLFFTGLSSTPLTTASTIMFLSPIMVTVLAIPILGEQVGIRRWIGVAIGFLGALIIVRPDTGAVAAGHLALIGAAVSNSLYQIITRLVRAKDNAMTSLLYSGLVGSIVTSGFVPFYWQAADGLEWALFVLMGLLGATSHFCLIRAFSVAPASDGVPFSYSSLLWATLFGYAISHTARSMDAAWRTANHFKRAVPLSQRAKKSRETAKSSVSLDKHQPPGHTMNPACRLKVIALRHRSRVSRRDSE